MITGHALKISLIINYDHRKSSNYICIRICLITMVTEHALIKDILSNFDHRTRSNIRVHGH